MNGTTSCGFASPDFAARPEVESPSRATRLAEAQERERATRAARVERLAARRAPLPEAYRGPAPAREAARRALPDLVIPPAAAE